MWLHLTMSSTIISILLLFLLLPFQLEATFAILPQTNVAVKIEQGLVSGVTMTSSSGRTIYSYLGIPYAEPPIGNLRFKPPVPHKKWPGTFEATNEPNPCPQQVWFVINGGVEDCLMLNVYTPEPPNKTNEKLTVLVYIHGGTFNTGAITATLRLGPGYLLNKNVVLVTLQYRLGVLGFLSTGDSAAPGNYGLLDQNLALKWVKANIASFGGDPDRVTIYGEGAGAASVTYHLLSPLSKGLFRAAICESGTALAPRFLQDTPLKWAQHLGLAFNCPINDNFKLVACLKQQNALDLVINGQNNLNSAVRLLNVFNPVVEPKGTDGAFLTESPFTLLQNGQFTKVPLIIGVNKDEGQSAYADSAEKYANINSEFFQKTLPMILSNLTNVEHKLLDLSYSVKKEYFDKINVDNQNEVTWTAINMYSDMLMIAPTELTVSYIAKYSTVYTYVFNYAGSCSKTSYGGQTVVNNADELCYIFKPLLNPTALNNNDLAISDKFVDWWTTFATNLKPTSLSQKVVWTATSSNSFTYLRINSATDLSMQNNYRSNQMNFWNVKVPAIVKQQIG